MWEKITATGTVILIILTGVLIWQGFNRPPSALMWLFISLVIVGLVIAAILNLKAARIKHLDTATRPPSLSIPSVPLRIFVSSPGISFRLTSDRRKVWLDLVFTTSAAIELIT